VPSESARLDLYNGLSELLGPERAETLMASLPNFGPNGVATSADFGVLQARMDGLETGLGARMDALESGLGARMDALEFGLGARMDGLETRMTSIESAVVALGLRLDKMFLAMVAGLFAIVAAMVGVIIAV
jgi:hypothetical protein